jgi:transcription antitermination protein NusB
MSSGPRHQAREAALQVLYFWEVGRATPEDALTAFFTEHAPEAAEPVQEFARSLVQGTITEVAALDALIEQHSQHWRMSRLAIIDRLILRMSVWELEHERDTPAAVVLDEALELARTFSTEEAVKFVNGVLDGIRKTLASRG